MKGTKMRLSPTSELGERLLEPKPIPDWKKVDAEANNDEKQSNQTVQAIRKTKEEVIRFRAVKGTSKALRKMAKDSNFDNMSEMIRAFIWFSASQVPDVKKRWDNREHGKQ